MKREIILDTETTGLSAINGDKIIEVACVELLNHVATGNYYHTYINPEGKKISIGAFKVHGISNTFLLKKPTFIEIAKDLCKFIGNDTLIAHNANFDIEFLNKELSLAKLDNINNVVIDTLAIARNKFPGAPVSLDALCKKYQISLENRALHSALIDCNLLAKVYLELIGGAQTNLLLSSINENDFDKDFFIDNYKDFEYRCFDITEKELNEHKVFIKNYIPNSIWNCYQ